MPASSQATVVCGEWFSPHPYLIFYEATEDEIVIHGVRHGARRPSTPE
jgi:hypothetical protein